MFLFLFITFFVVFVFYVFVCILCIFVSCIFPNSELVVPYLSNFMKRWAVGLASQSPKVVWKLCTVRTHDTHLDGFGHWLVITDHWDLQLELKESEWQNPIPIPIWHIMSTTFSDIIAENLANKKQLNRSSFRLQKQCFKSMILKSSWLIWRRSGALWKCRIAMCQNRLNSGSQNQTPVFS